MTEDQQKQQDKIAEFVFVTNKSFFGRGNPITIPSRFYPKLKEAGLLESGPATVTFGNNETTTGTIHISWRAGGKYYQIRINAPDDHGITQLKQGVNLRVQVLKESNGWKVQLQ